MVLIWAKYALDKVESFIIKAERENIYWSRLPETLITFNEFKLLTEKEK